MIALGEVWSSNAETHNSSAILQTDRISRPARASFVFRFSPSPEPPRPLQISFQRQRNATRGADNLSEPKHPFGPSWSISSRCCCWWPPCWDCPMYWASAGPTRPPICPSNPACYPWARLRSTCPWTSTWWPSSSLYLIWKPFSSSPGRSPFSSWAGKASQPSHYSS